MATGPDVQDESPGDDAGDESADDRTGGGRSRVRERAGALGAGAGAYAGGVVNGGAGWALGLLLWGWVVLPFIKGGPPQVKKTLMAKFLNKAPDGSALP